MKHNSEWGNGKIVADDLSAFSHKNFSGGIGTTLTGDNTFCLKLVSLMKSGVKADGSVTGEGKLSEKFWQEAKSASLYYSVARNISGCVACPVPPHYWIHENDTLFQNFPRTRMSEERVRSLLDFISLFDIKPQQLFEKDINPEEYWLVPEKLLDEIYNENLKCNLLLTYPILQGKYSIANCNFFRHKIKSKRAKSVIAYHSEKKWIELLESDKSWSSIFQKEKKIAELLEKEAEEEQRKAAFEIRLMIYQILSAILALYRNGLAHCDIKPDNIMKAKGYASRYFLTDIGGMHSSNLPSGSGTEAYFNSKLNDEWNKEKDAEKFNKEHIGNDDLLPDVDLSCEELKTLLMRTLMDGYALGLTIFDLANPDSTPNINRHGTFFCTHKITTAWKDEKITEIFRTLLGVDKLTIAAMQRIVDDLEENLPPALKKRKEGTKVIKIYGRESEFRFSAMSGGKLLDGVTLEYGFLREQKNFSEKCNPVMRIKYDIELNNRFVLPECVLIQPLVENYTNGNKLYSRLFYAPDDVHTGNRAVDWKHYTPCSLDYVLENNLLKEEQYAALLELGKVIDESVVYDEFKFKFKELPYPNDIVMIDGEWKVCPFFLGSFEHFSNFSFQEYFKMLCGRENKLTAENWGELLIYDRGVGILFELIPDNMAEQVAALVRKCCAEKEQALSNLKNYPIGDVDLSELQDVWRAGHKELSETEKFRKYFDDLPLDSVK